ncbi:MAG: cyclic nucleotide-binding domain-containing protein [Spirochaetota bacterium]
MPGPILRNYSDGSIIYFEKERAENIYVLKSGKIILTYTAVDSGIEVKEDVRIGEFFGVKSTLGHYPREETAQVVGKATVFVFKLAEFEALVAKNPHLLLKMMKSFSSQLRQYHSKVKEHLGDFEEIRSPAFELVNAGEVFYKNNANSHAIYAFKQYLSKYPDGAYAARVKQLLEAAEKGATFPSKLPELVFINEKQGSVPVNSLQSEIDNLKNQAQSGDVVQDFKSLKEQLQQCKELSKEQDWENAIRSLKSIAATKNPADEEERATVEEANYFLGVCQKDSKDLEHAFATFSQYIKLYPSGQYVKNSIFALGEISEEKGDVAKAMALYNKVSAIPPENEINQNAKQKMAELKG